MSEQQTAPATHQGYRGVQRTNTTAATEATQQYAAERAIEDPAKLAKAVRIVRTAVERRPEQIRRIVDQAPQPSPELLARIAALLYPGSDVA